MTYLLGSSGVGDVASQPILPLVTRAPLNPTIPNLDIDRDDKPGLSIRRDGAFEIDMANRLQRFRLDTAGLLAIEGRAAATLWMAALDFRDRDDVQAAVALMDCSDLLEDCTLFASASINFTTTTDQFSRHTLDFGTVSHEIPAANNLQLWIISPKTSTQHIMLAYDTGGFESVLTLND